MRGFNPLKARLRITTQEMFFYYLLPFNFMFQSAKSASSNYNISPRVNGDSSPWSFNPLKARLRITTSGKLMDRNEELLSFNPLKARLRITTAIDLFQKSQSS